MDSSRNAERESHPDKDSISGGDPSKSPNFNIPDIIRSFQNKSPLEIIKTLAPTVPDDQLGGLLAGLGLNLGIPIPEWATASSKQFWKYFVGADFDPFKSQKHAGVLVGLAEQMLTVPPLQEPQPFGTWIKEILKWFLEVSSQEALKLPPEEAAKFHLGRAKSAGIAERIRDPDYLQMIKRAPVYLTVAIRWKTVQSFTSQAEVDRWLRAEKVISQNLDDREVRAILSLIGLKYRRPGRPKKKKTDAAITQNPDSSKNRKS